MVGRPGFGCGLQGQRLVEADRDRGRHRCRRVPDALSPECTELAVVVRRALVDMDGLRPDEGEEAENRGSEEQTSHRLMILNIMEAGHPGSF